MKMVIMHLNYGESEMATEEFAHEKAEKMDKAKDYLIAKGADKNTTEDIFGYWIEKIK